MSRAREICWGIGIFLVLAIAVAAWTSGEVAFLTPLKTLFLIAMLLFVLPVAALSCEPAIALMLGSLAIAVVLEAAFLPVRMFRWVVLADLLVWACVGLYASRHIAV